MFSQHDADMMRKALRLAERGLGRTSPNPAVGAVVCDARGRVLSSGWHRKAGLDHAEVAALRELGFRAPGATLYVTLEPCNHHGQTPPCTESILRAGVSRIIVAMRDPHPRVDGRGLRRLRSAGVRVELGLLHDEAQALNRAFLCRLRLGRPRVTLKLAETLDGKIATARGDSRWVTGPKARALGHRMRNRHDAILVGARTIAVDDPQLTTRGIARGHNPVRVILDGRLRTSPRARVLPAWILAARGANSKAKAALERAGATIIEFPGRQGRIDVRRALMALAARGINSVLAEGGGQTADELLRAGCVDEVVVFVAPKIVGGQEAIPAVGGLGVARMGDAIVLSDLRLRRIGPDVMIWGDVHGADRKSGNRRGAAKTRR